MTPVEIPARERALAPVTRNLLVLFAFQVPLVALLALISRNRLEHFRLWIWLLAATADSLIGMLFVIGYRRWSRPAGTTPRWVVIGLVVASAGLGVVVGAAPWVAATASRDTVLMAGLFPAVAGSLGAVMLAGRLDIFLTGLLTMFATSTWAMYSTGDSLLRQTSSLNLLFVIALTCLYFVVSRTVASAFELQTHTTELLRQLAADRATLTDLNAELTATNAQLLHQAQHDPLTGLRNRRGTLDVLDAFIAEATPTEPVGLLFIDLDRFKSVNDTLGHRGGDRFISVLADRLLRSVAKPGEAGRMGGDEFVVVVPKCDEASIIAIAQRCLAALGQPVHAEGREMPSSGSIGVASAPSDGATSSELLRNANAALYRAKAAGRNRIEVFDESMRTELNTRLEDENALRRALDQGDIVPFFQPEIDASTGQVVGAELLARWVRQDGTITTAGDFLRLAARAGLLERVTEVVLQGARQYIRRLANLGLPAGFRFRVNVAPRSTARSWRDNPIEALISGIDPRLMTVDVREAAVSSDLAAATSNLAAFRDQGGLVCLDDFARGVSSLSLLRSLPLDEVRIDRVSIDTITAHPHDRAIVRSIIALAREIGLAVTAEGVETGAQADTLIALGCVRQQGHLYAPALPAAEFEDFLLERLAERYNQRIPGLPTWQTDELT
ncbi:MAG: EAL domain-containing protein [Ilumatobacteraceae bacterium]